MAQPRVSCLQQVNDRSHIMGITRRANRERPLSTQAGRSAGPSERLKPGPATAARLHRDDDHDARLPASVWTLRANGLRRVRWSFRRDYTESISQYSRDLRGRHPGGIP